MTTRELPARASLENLRKQAKGLHKAFADGEDDAVARIRTHLPRAAGLDDNALRALDLSLQEAQHVLAKEYELPSWDALRDAVTVPSFDELALLTDMETQRLMRQISQKDLCRSIIGASKAVRGRFLSNMSNRVRGFIMEEAESLAQDLPDHEPEASRQRLVEAVLTLRGNGQIEWPPPADRTPYSGDFEKRQQIADAVEDPLGGLSFEELEIVEIAKIYGELATVAKRDGILALQAYIPPGLPMTPFRDGLRLIVDGTEPAIVESLLGTRLATMVHHRRIRLQMITEGIAALQAGDNPWIIYDKMQAFYLDTGEGDTPARLREDLTGEELHDWFERGWMLTRKPTDIAHTFLQMAFVARNHGIAELAAAAAVIEEPLLKVGLDGLIADRDNVGLRDQLEARAEAEVRRFESHNRAAVAGVLAMQKGREPADVAQAVHDAAQ